ncbi:MAG: carbohydrate binding family 9 domain-containing protein, partial [Chitinophagales bacterium]|nr:carbohydrate binding family 9 domain-containing protein [Chitinophagales bacterium]
MNLRLQHLFLICILCLLSINASAQKTINIKKAVGKIQLDGTLNEPDWQQAEIANNFWQTLPTDTSAARSQTEVRLTYDQRNLYVSAVCYNAQQTDNYVIQSLKRDFSFPVNDAFALMLDPFYNRTNGINFSVSAAGVQREGTIDNAGLDGVTTAFDTKWFSETKNYGDKWIVEMAIPFKVLRYSDKQMQWGINFARNDLQINETSTWSAVSRQFNVAYLVQEGILQWDKAPRKTGANVALIPYVWEGLSDNDVTDTEKTKVSLPETGL